MGQAGSDADNTVKKVVDEIHSDKAHTGDVNKGYEVLNKEFQNFVSQHNGDSKAVSEYWQAVQSGLNKEDKAILPELALVYGKTVGANDISHDDASNLTKRDLDRFATSKMVNRSPLDDAMVKELDKQFSDLSSFAFTGPNYIKQSTLDSHITDANKHLKIDHDRAADADKAGDMLSKLMGNDGDAKHSLFNAINSAPGKHAGDGFVDQTKLTNYINEYSRLVDQMHTPADRMPPGYSKENFDFVQHLNAAWSNPTDKDYQTVQLLRGANLSKDGDRRSADDSISLYTVKSLMSYGKNDDVYNHFKQ